MDNLISGHAVINSLVFSGIGIVVLILAFVIVDIITPKCPIWKEIIEKQNVAVSIVMGSFLIGVAIIIAAAVHG
jgi:uncharacterized membrane protein YjfL (UPF0719 family)